MTPSKEQPVSVNWRKVIGLTAIVLGLGLTGCGSDNERVPVVPTPTPTPGTIVDVALANPDFSILVEAVVAADLVSVLSGEGPFTVFAPTNAAFAALLGELGVSKEELLGNKDLLTAVLTYHVVGARVGSADVPLGSPIEPLGTGFFKIDQVDGQLVVTDGRNRTANVTATDIPASNGVIHVLDRVILPADKTVVETAVTAAQADPPQFSILVEAVVAAGLVDALSAAGPFTVFAPTDAAFADLLGELGVSKEDLLGNVGLLTQVLTYHVVPGLVLAAGVPLDLPIGTLLGETATFSVGNDLAITDQRGRRANIVATDVLASNGVIHVLDKVILPSAP